jgi:seryl-tRNA synthetase
MSHTKNLTAIAIALTDHGVMSKEDGDALLAAAEEIRRLEAKVEEMREAKRREAEFLGQAVEQMALRLAAMNTRLEAEVREAKMQAHLTRLQVIDSNINIGPNARKGSE